MIDSGSSINPNVTIPDAPKAMRRFANGDEILGRYVVESELGQGGMGVVYRCFDKVGGVDVAVKGLPPEVSHNSDEMEEVRRNFQLVCALRHPGIAGIRTLEREESTGLYYLVMDVAEGQNLTRWMREHDGSGLTPEKLTILRDIVSALDYAHERRILHRDIKPGNIMVGPDGHAQVLDFGLAAQIRSSMSRVSMMVTSQSGTPAYKSPEQWKGRPQRAAADQYSLAVIAYKMITGELPFDGDDLTMLGRAVMNEPPEKAAGVSAPVNAALQKALAKEPEDRFESCAAFVAALSSDGRARTPAAPLKWIAASVLLLTLAAIGGWWWRERVKSEELRVKNEALAAERAESDRAVAEARAEAKRVADEKRQAEERRQAAEARKIAAEKTEQERADADRRRQEEVAKLTTTRTKITIKVSAAKDDYAKVAPYRSEKEGFESHLSEIDRQWEAVEGIQNPKTLAEAEKTLAAVTEAADAIAFELNWLATNRDGRDAAKRIEKEITDELEPKLREFKADDVARSKYDKGQGERKAAAQALSRGEFASARSQYEAAKATLAAALAEARQFHVKTALAVANEYKTAAQWQKCCDELTKVLGWDPQNADALALKREAESHLKPTLRIVAKIGDREVSATFRDSKGTHTTPFEWEDGLTQNKPFPSWNIVLRHAEVGKIYVGELRQQNVDWRGSKTVVVDLAEKKTETVNGVTWTFTVENGQSSVMSISDDTVGLIEIPRILGGCAVTRIGTQAFCCRGGLTSVSIHSGITSIGDSAFLGCNGLASILIPSSVTSIEGNPFSCCAGLTRIEVEQGNPVYASHEGVLIDNVGKVFVACPGGCSSVVIPPGVTSIGRRAFYSCEKLTVVTIPTGVTRVGEEAFAFCRGLASVSIPSSVTSIGDKAFNCCKRLTSVTIPSSMTSIEGNPFVNCKLLTSIDVEQGNRVYSSWNGVLIDRLNKTLVACPGGCKSVEIPSSVMAIGDQAFYACDGLASVTIPSGVVNIGEWAFSWCENLASVTIPSSVTNIGVSAFRSCKRLSSVTISSGVVSIGNQAFSWCKGLTSVSIPSSVTHIEGNPFESCEILTGIEVDRGNWVYASRNGLLLDKVDKVLVACPGGCALADIPPDVTSIGERAFASCAKLTSVVIPTSVTNIGACAFSSCRGLKSVMVPSGVTSIGEDAFSGCAELMSVMIPLTVARIGESPFVGCERLTRIEVEHGNPVYASRDGVMLIDKANKTLVSCPAGGESVVIPSDVTRIGYGAFSHCKRLTSVTIPSNIKNIGGHSFLFCSQLRTVRSDDPVKAKALMWLSGADVEKITFEQL